MSLSVLSPAEQKGGPPRRKTAVALPGARGLRWLWVACAGLVTAGTLMRVTGLGKQSYWIDEIFTVLQCAGSRETWWELGRPEVHPPFFAFLERGWITMVGTAPAHTRVLSALLGASAAPIMWWMLRRAALPDTVKVVIIAATAVNGFAVTYSQDTRSYVLLWLASVGLTAATTRLVVGEVGHVHTGSRWAWVSWTLWLGIASATHLMGLILGCAAAAVLVIFPLITARIRLAAWLRRIGVVSLLLLIGALPQLVWLWHGSQIEGFPQNITWIPAPTLASIPQLLTSVFAWGDLTIQPTGFLWSSWVLVILLGLLLVMSFGLRLSYRRRVTQKVESAELRMDTSARRALYAWIAMTLLVMAVTWSMAHYVHIWTLRGMIVVAPALSCAAVAGIVTLAPSGRFKVWAAGTLLAVLALSAVMVTYTLQTTRYKSDFAGAIEYLRATRAENPHTHLVLSSLPSIEQWALASTQGGPEDVTWLRQGSEVVPREAYIAAVHPRPGTTVYLWYDEPEPSKPERVATVIAAGGGEQFCRSVPLVGVVMVRCDVP